MKGILFKLTFVLFHVICNSTSFADLQKEDQTLKIVCYWQGSGQNEFMPQDMNSSLCTHIIFGFARVQNGQVVPQEPEDLEKYRTLISLKQNTTKPFSVLISVGSSTGNEMSIAVSNEENRTKFAKSCLDFVIENGFDGIDFDWEFPSWAGAPFEDKANFVDFLKVLREKISTQKPSLVLTIAVAAPETIVSSSYDVPGLALYVDFINLMTYDFHIYQWYDPFTGSNSPLFKRNIEKAFFATTNTAWAAENWVAKGMPRDKVVVGIPTYGYAYNLALSEMNGLDAPATSGIGQWSYMEACRFLSGGAQRVFDNESHVPYAFKDKIWLSYDDQQSVETKSKWIKINNFGGVMTWNLNNDDWKNTCGAQKFPLHSIIHRILTQK